MIPKIERPFFLAGGIGEGLLIKHGEIVQKLPEEELLDALRNELLNWSE